MAPCNSCKEAILIDQVGWRQSDANRAEEARDLACVAHRIAAPLKNHVLALTALRVPNDGTYSVVSG